jgi:hypothetical protein
MTDYNPKAIFGEKALLQENQPKEEEDQGGLQLIF